MFEEQTTADEVTALDLLVAGKITICWGVKFGDDLTDSLMMALIDDEPVFGPNTYQTVHSRLNNGTNNFEMGAQLQIQTFTRSYPTVDPFSSGDQFPVRFSWTVAQISGTSEDIEFAFLDVGYEAADICEGPILS